MAGRPVTVHGGPSGLLYGMISFAIVAVAALGSFIFQLTQNKAAESSARAAEEKLQRIGNPPAYYMDEATARGRGNSATGVMAENLRNVARVVTGVEEDVGPVVESKVERLITDLSQRTGGAVNKGDTLLTAMSTLGNLYGQAQANLTSLDAQVRDLQAEKGALTQQLNATRQQFEGQMASLSEQLTQVREEIGAALDQKDAQLHELQGTLDATEAQLQTMKREGNTVVRDKDIEIGRLQTLIGELQKQIQSLKPGNFDPNAILTKADGRIVRAIPGSDLVYIDVGSSDRVRPGMGFEVFSAAHSAGELRGKASLEIVTVMEDTAECRVTRNTPGQPIIEGDLVVNIAFERNRRPKFVVRGEFDLDYDGTADYNGVEQITSMIEQWGGQVVDDLDEAVDYVVIGLPPGRGVRPDERTTAVVRSQMMQQELARTAFGALVDRAQKMFIPVITQNQFLFLTGFSGDTRIVRR